MLHYPFFWSSYNHWTEKEKLRPHYQQVAWCSGTSQPWISVLLQLYSWLKEYEPPVKEHDEGISSLVGKISDNKSGYLLYPG